MERLTEWRDGHGALLHGDGYTKLAQYEDTGFEPEEIERVHETLLTTQRLKKEQFEYLQKFLRAQAEGRIVQIPPEGRIYWIGREDFTDDLEIESGLFCYTDGKTYHVKTVWGGRLFDTRDAGRDFFLTMKDAEAELERRTNERSHL